MDSGTGRAALMAASAIICMASAAPVLAQTRSFDIPAQDATTGVAAFARQANIQVFAARRDTSGRRTNAVRGEMTVDRALAVLLDGTGLTMRRTSEQTYTIVAAASQGEAEAGGAAADDAGAEAGATPDILVIGRGTLNADIRRTENDTQPYVVFEAEELARSNADNIEDFLRTRLPQNAVERTNALAPGTGPNGSSVNLRGLGTNQTLVLVDGRRLPSTFSGIQFVQPDINAIPLASIERIEILPSTGSGIYGGGATGGVVNIITRHDYSGFNVGVTYASTFDWEAATRRIDIGAGFTLGGRTRVRIAASHSDSGQLLAGERDFVERARALLLRNNPAAFANATQPPFGFTPNICRAASASAQTCASQALVFDNGTSLGSNRTFVPIGYSGPASDDGAALAGNAGQYNLRPSDDHFSARGSLLADPTIDSVLATLRHDFGSGLEVFVDAAWLRNRTLSFSGNFNNLINLPANAPNNPFNSPILVRFPGTGLSFPTRGETETLSGTAGLIYRFAPRWTAEADFTRSASTFESSSTNPPINAAGNAALAAGTLDVVRDLNAFPLDYSPYLLPSPNFLFGPAKTVLDRATLRVAGSALQFPGGPLSVTGLLEHVREAARTSFRNVPLANGTETIDYRPGRSQRADSVYLEARAPLVSERNRVPLVHMLELQGSVRHDRYSTRSPDPQSIVVPSRDGPLPAVAFVTNEVDATNFTLGARYAPIPDLTFRASWGTGFLPPAVNQIVEGTPAINAIVNLADPKRGAATVATGPLTIFQGGNALLLPEESESWSVGAILIPRLLPGFRLSVDYTHISKTNEIFALTQQLALTLEDALPGRVVRQPLTPADQALGFTGGTIVSIDATSINVLGTEVEAVDVQADYRFEIERLGRFHLYGVATWQPTFRRQTAPISEMLNLAGTTGQPLEWRGNAGLIWETGPWTVGWNAQYYSSYLVYSPLSTQATRDQQILDQGSDRIRRHIFHDLSASYRIGRTPWLRDTAFSETELSLGIQNIFDARPAVLAGNVPNGGFSRYGDPRLRRFTVALRTSF